MTKSPNFIWNYFFRHYYSLEISSYFCGLLRVYELYPGHCFCNMNLSTSKVYLLDCKSQCGGVRSIVDDKFWHWKCERWLHDWTSTHAIQNAKGYWQLAETQLRDLQLWKIRVCDLQKKVLCMYMIIMNDGVPITVIRGMWGKKKTLSPTPYILEIFYLPVK